MQLNTGPSRRRSSRIPANDDVWIYWESQEARPHRDVSRIRDLSPGGLFLETHARKKEGEMVRLHFLVQEGQIRAEAMVRHVNGHGLGMKIESLSSQDAPQLKKLLSRLRENSTSRLSVRALVKP
jgi:c-di-GMP-binding flagellar brake protein YcgR